MTTQSSTPDADDHRKLTAKERTLYGIMALIIIGFTLAALLLIAVFPPDVDENIGSVSSISLLIATGCFWLVADGQSPPARARGRLALLCFICMCIIIILAFVSV